MSRFKATWKLVKRSFGVLKREKRLLVFPIVTSVLTVVIFLFFLSPIFFQPTGHSYGDPEHWEAIAGRLFHVESLPPGMAPEGSSGEHVELTPWFVGYLMAMYLVAMFLLTFFNAAFFHEILNALNERPVSILGGLRFALTKLKPIAMWSLLAGAVGILIQSLERRLGFLSRWVIAMIGIVWSVASVFAVPVLIREDSPNNPFEVLKKSATLIKRRWGEGLIGYVGIRVFSATLAIALVLFYTVLLIFVGYYAGQFWPSIFVPIIVFLIATWFLSVCLVAYLENVVNKIFQCALYVYAAEGEIPGPFDRALLDAAWKVSA